MEIRHIAALEAQMEALTWQNEELLLRISEQTHSRGEPGGAWRRRAQQLYSHPYSSDRQEDDHQEDNFWEHDRRKQRNGKANWQGDLNRIAAELERRCTNMEMRMKDNNKSIVVDRLLSGTNSPFTRRVADFQLPEKFKVPQIMGYARDGDPLEHLEDFWAHLDLHGTFDEFACRVFPLILSGNAWD
jgi:hypothetical protein